MNWKPGPLSFHVYNQYTIRAPTRDQLLEYLHDQGILPMSTIRALFILSPRSHISIIVPASFRMTRRPAVKRFHSQSIPSLLLDQQRAVVASISRFYSREPSKESS